MLGICKKKNSKIFNYLMLKSGWGYSDATYTPVLMYGPIHISLFNSINVFRSHLSKEWNQSRIIIHAKAMALLF
jgi:hypothetical protein